MGDILRSVVTCISRMRLRMGVGKRVLERTLPREKQRENED